MSNDDKNEKKQVILSENPDDVEEKRSSRPVVVSGIAVSVFTLFYIFIIFILPFGTILEFISNPILNSQGYGVGSSDHLFGIRMFTSIYCAGLFFFLSDVLLASSKLLSQNLSEKRLGLIMNTYPHVWGNILIFLFIIPFLVIVITTFVASELSNPDELWKVIVAGYAGAIIGVYRQIISRFLPKY